MERSDDYEQYIVVLKRHSTPEQLKERLKGLEVLIIERDRRVWLRDQVRHVALWTSAVLGAALLAKSSLSDFLKGIAAWLIQ